MALLSRAAKLNLYRDILRTHRRRLPHDMRALGDAYVKEEWRRHRKAEPAYLPYFFKEWNDYVGTLKKQHGKLGADLDKSDVANLAEEHKQQLENLRKEALKLKRK